jgi:hypothetical protein
VQTGAFLSVVATTITLKTHGTATVMGCNAGFPLALILIRTCNFGTSAAKRLRLASIRHIA